MESVYIRLNRNRKKGANYLLGEPNKKTWGGGGGGEMKTILT